MTRRSLHHGSMTRRQLRLRTLMAAIAAIALVLGWARSQGSLVYALVVAAHSRIAWAIGFALPFAIARAFGPFLRPRSVRVADWGLLALALPSLLYLAWAHERVAHGAWGKLVHDFPHPDWAINSLERWFDARRPTPPGILKIHGEFPLVGLVLGLVVLGLFGLIGLLIGLLMVRPEEAKR